MAVIAVWKCDRDGAMFENKKDAEAHDKMLELAESITGLLRDNIEGIDDHISEEVGLLLARRRDDLCKACKGNPEALRAAPADDNAQEDEKVTNLAAHQ